MPLFLGVVVHSANVLFMLIWQSNYWLDQWGLTANTHALVRVIWNVSVLRLKRMQFTQLYQCFVFNGAPLAHYDPATNPTINFTLIKHRLSKQYFSYFFNMASIMCLSLLIAPYITNFKMSLFKKTANKLFSKFYTN